MTGDGSQQTEHLAIGVDGTNLLGYLAALGALALLDRAWPDRQVRLSWTLPRQGPAAGAWRAVLHVEPGVTQAELVGALLSAVRACGALAWAAELHKNLEVDRATYVALAQATVRLARADRRAADLVAALLAEKVGDKKEPVARSPLQALRGAGHQDFLETLRKLSERVQAGHLRQALFEPWAYRDDKLTFRWDPVDYRPYALRARDPGADEIHPIRTEWGANRLAFEALIFFPQVWSRDPKTVGFIGNEEIRWPLWSAPASVSLVRSLLVQGDLLTKDPSRLSRLGTRLSRLGICAVVGARRFLSSKGYVNFAPARIVWSVVSESL